MISNNLGAIFNTGIVPVVVLEDIHDAVPLARALAAGGIPIAEITFRTKAAAEIIQVIANHVPEILVGAGTVHTVPQAKSAAAHGAKFIVTPGFQPEVVKWCQDYQVDVIPGAVTPSEIEQAMMFGLTVCKFFPAEAYGGTNTLKQLAGPYSEIKFMPTGGITIDNMADYLRLSNVGAVGGSLMMPAEMVRQKKWDEIAKVCQKVVEKINKSRCC